MGAGNESGLEGAVTAVLRPVGWFAEGGPGELGGAPWYFDAKTLAAAIKSVPDGGIIELAAGTYASPGSNGFLVNNARKGFTVRAAAGAAVVLDGGGSRALLRFANSDRARGKLVTFERITFQNGFSAKSGMSGGVTLSKAEALFRDCSFLNNRAAAPQTGGGAVKVLDGSSPPSGRPTPQISRPCPGRWCPAP